MKKIRLLAFVLCLAMLFSFAGCGERETEIQANSEESNAVLVDFDDDTASGVGKDNNNSSSGNKGETSVNVSQGTKVEKPVSVDGNDPFANIPSRLRGTTVTFAHFGDEGADEYKKLGTAFTKKTGIKVKWVSFPQAEYEAQVAKQINAGLAPDIVICNGMFPSGIELVQPLNGMLNLDEDFWADFITKVTTVGGKTYFVNSAKGPWLNGSTVVFNKQIFSSKGIKSPEQYYKEANWTWENYQKCLEQVKAAGHIGGLLDGWQLATATGNPVIGYDSDKKEFYSKYDNIAEYLQISASNVKTGIKPPAEWWGTFGNGNTGLWPGGTYGLKFNGYFKDADDAILAAVPLPNSYKGKHTKQVVSLRAYGIAKGAMNPEGAVYFLRYFLDFSYYKEAKCNPFKNKSLEKFYFETLMPYYEKGDVEIDYVDNVYLQTGTTLANHVGALDEPNSVATKLKSQKNIVDNVVKKCNEQIAKYK